MDLPTHLPEMSGHSDAALGAAASFGTPADDPAHEAPVPLWRSEGFAEDLDA